MLYSIVKEIAELRSIYGMKLEGYFIIRDFPSVIIADSLAAHLSKFLSSKVL